MRFYEDMVRASKETVHEVACQIVTQQVELDARQFAGMALDTIFEEFQSSTGWPKDRLEFTEREATVKFSLTPSEVMTEAKDGSFGVCAFFHVGTKWITEVVSLRDIDSSKSELTIGEDVFPIQWREMPCCPPFSPMIVVKLLAAHVMRARLRNRIHE